MSKLLTKLAAKAAHRDLQDAIEELDTLDPNMAASNDEETLQAAYNMCLQHLNNCNEWLLALQAN